MEFNIDEDYVPLMLDVSFLRDEHVLPALYQRHLKAMNHMRTTIWTDGKSAIVFGHVLYMEIYSRICNRILSKVGYLSHFMI